MARKKYVRMAGKWIRIIWLIRFLWTAACIARVLEAVIKVAISSAGGKKYLLEGNLIKTAGRLLIVGRETSL